MFKFNMYTVLIIHTFCLDAFRKLELLKPHLYLVKEIGDFFRTTLFFPSTLDICLVFSKKMLGFTPLSRKHMIFTFPFL